MTGFVLALDAGTTSVRCMLFGRRGEVLAVSQRALRQIYPGPGMVEHDPAEIRDSCVGVIRDCLSRPGIDPGECVAMGITNQRETTVVWDARTGEPLCNAIVWQDRRTHTFCQELRDRGLGETVLSKTGLQVDAYFSGTKLRWILENVPGARDGAESGDVLFGTVESWLMWCLTGGKVHATDYSNAARTMMFNITDLAWDSELLEILGIPEAMLPTPCPPGHVFGTIDPSVIGVSVPIASALGDQQAALFGQTCFDRGDVKITFGTGGFLLMNIGGDPRITSRGLLTTVAWNAGGATEYALEGSIYIAGAAVQWLRDELQIVEESAETERMAESVEDTCGCYVVPAFVGLGAPHWDQNARGIIMGLTRGTNRCHIARASLESIAFQANDVIRAMEADSGTGDGGRFRDLHPLSEGRWRRQREQLPVPVPRGHHRHGGRAPSLHRVHSARCRVHGRAGGRLLGRRGRSQGELVPGQEVRAADGRGRAAGAHQRLEPCGQMCQAVVGN